MGHDSLAVPTPCDARRKLLPIEGTPLDQYIQAIVALLAIANPLAAVPVFLEAVDGTDKKQRRKPAFLAAVSVFAILLVAAIAGNWVLDIFDVSIAAFRCGGGLVILLMGLTMLQGRTSRVQKESLTHNDRLTKIFVPLAMPLIAGPGAITTVITIALAEPYWKNLSVALTAIVVLASVLWLMLILSQRVHELLGPLGQKILLRFFGLILVAIGVQFMLAGAYEFFTDVMEQGSQT